MTFTVERRRLGETETERARARHAAVTAARAAARATKRPPARLAGLAPRGFTASNLNGGHRCQNTEDA